jgi:protein TonB
MQPFAADTPPRHRAQQVDAGADHWLRDRYKVGFAALVLAGAAAFQGYLLAKKWRTPAPEVQVAATSALETKPAVEAVTPPPLSGVPASAGKDVPTAAPAASAAPKVAATAAAPSPAPSAGATAKSPTVTTPKLVEPAPVRTAADTSPVATNRPASPERKPEPLREDRPPAKRPPPQGLQLPTPSVAATTTQGGRLPPVATPTVEPTPAPVAAAEPREAARAAPPAASVVKRAGREPEFPKEAAREGLTRGSVRARVLIDGAGNVTSVDILDSRPSRVFDRAVRRALMDWKFNPGTENRNYEAEIDFKREN